MTRRTYILLSLLIVLGAFGGWLFATMPEAEPKPDPGGIVARESREGRETVTIMTERYTMDRIRMSMMGPSSFQRALALFDARKPETLWVTGIDTEVVDGESLKTVSPEFFCHSNLAVHRAMAAESEEAGMGAGLARERMFTLVPGRMNIKLPRGFGIPIQSDAEVTYDSMVLNLNVIDRIIDVRLKTRVHFIRESRREGNIIPLFMRALYGLEPVTEETLAELVTETEDGEECSSCGPHRGQMATRTGDKEYLDAGYTIHWYVPPGRYTFSTDVTSQLQLASGTRTHYATAHLHPFGESVELFDMTLGETVLRFGSEDYPDKLGVSKMHEFEFPDGVPIHPDHRYELITVYNNTSEENVDAMSILYLYLRDRAAKESSTQLAGRLVD